MGSQHQRNQHTQNDIYSKTAPKEKVPASQPKARNADVHADTKDELRQKKNQSH